MSDPTILCPHCQGSIKLSESLAAPLLQKKESEFRQQLAKQTVDLQERAAALRHQEDELCRTRASLDEQVIGRVAVERSRIVEEEQRKARLLLGNELVAKQQELSDLGELYAFQQRRLAEAQQAQAEIVRKERELQQTRLELELIIEQRVSANVADIQQKARQDAEQLLKLKIGERDVIDARSLPRVHMPNRGGFIEIDAKPPR